MTYRLIPYEKGKSVSSTTTADETTTDVKARIERGTKNVNTDISLQFTDN